MYKLYGSLGTGSAAVEAALAEAGAEYQVIPVVTKDGAHLTDEYTTINPRQQVPSLQLPDGSVMTEGAAMMMHIADAFPQAGLAPKPGTSARAQHDRWLVFMAVNIYEGELRRAYAERYSDDAKSVAAKAADYLKRHYQILEAEIAGPLFFGHDLTMVDIYLWNMATWTDPEWLAAHCPRVHALMTTVRNRALVAPIDVAHAG
jgi:glutathione S-transferase